MITSKGAEHFSDSYLAGIYVHDVEKKKALLVLHEFEEMGVDPGKILGIKDKYYLEKVRQGLTPMSALIYTRIMLEQPARPLPKTNFCVRCGKPISAFRIYCPECRGDIKNPRGDKSGARLPTIIKPGKKSTRIKDF